MFSFFFFNDTATTEIYTLSLHDALPISPKEKGLESWEFLKRRLKELNLLGPHPLVYRSKVNCLRICAHGPIAVVRSEEHTSELQSRLHLVCRLLLEKKKKIIEHNIRLK